MSESIELNNCPCCKGVVIWCDSISDANEDNHECDHLICTKCGLDFTLTSGEADNCKTISDMKKLVAERFNTRADANHAFVDEVDDEFASKVVDIATANLGDNIDTYVKRGDKNESGADVWISDAFRLPELCKQVLVCYVGHVFGVPTLKYTTAYMDDFGWRYHDNDQYLSFSVIRWMPLPSLDNF